MSVVYCNNHNEYIDTEVNAEHFEEEAMEALIESGLTEDEAERQLEDYEHSEMVS